MTLVPATGSAQPDGPGDGSVSIPTHVHVPACLRKTVETMLQRSETFRTQMAAIAEAPRLGIAIVFEPSQTRSPAEAVIRRYTTGVLLATIRIHALTNHAELLAHEIEHVREQVEGVPVAALARTSKAAWSIGRIYETERAIAAGRRVGHEMRTGDTPTP